MAEEDAQFTQAGLKGKRAKEEAAKIADKLKRGIGRADDLVTDAITKGVFEPLANLYPAAVNIAASIGEFGAGVAGRPASLGRFPYQTLPTQAQRRAAAAPIAPQEQEEVPTITVSKPRTRPQPKQEEPKRTWRVMFKGAPEQDQFFETKEQAEAALESERARRKLEREQMIETLGKAETERRLGKEQKDIGAVAGIRFKGKTPAEESEMLRQYMERSGAAAKVAEPATTEEGRIRERLAKGGATAEQQNKFLANLQRLRTERGAREEAEKKKSEDFFTSVAAKRTAEDQLNTYNRQLGDLKRAYSSARQSGNDLVAFQIGELLNQYQAGVPKEMGARRKAAEKGQIAAKNAEIAARLKRDKEEREKQARLYSANPDAPQYQGGEPFSPTSLTYR